MSSTEPDSKRLKSSHTDDDDDLTSLLLSPEIFQLEKSLQDEYRKATPYPHGCLPNVFQRDFLVNVLNEIKNNSKVNFKESDLFRVYQSIDLANLSEDDENNTKTLPSVMKLRKVLYSSKWRHFIERLASLPEGTLSEKVDCACNCHHTGCHLLCHDDVIGTRKISYILYLTEPEPQWTAKEGGSLELYENIAMGDQRVPTTVPSKCILPLFNHLAFFEVTPGQSFHAVQEVFGERPRLSLQGWYHSKEPPKFMEMASLQRLKQYGDDLEEEFVPCSIEPKQPKELSQEDKEFLSQYIHETYLDPQSIVDINKGFEENSSVQLRNFLVKTLMNKIRISMEAEESEAAANASDFYTHGTGKGWELVGPSHKQRFLEYKQNCDKDPSPIGEHLASLKKDLLQSDAFGRYLALLTELGSPTGHRGRIRRFRKGLDYTVAHYGLLTEESLLDATLCFAAGEGNQIATEGDMNEVNEADIEWQSGDSGGFECYIEAEDDNDGAADEYNQEDDTELLSVSASNNTLSLVYRDPGTMRFVKYVGSRAPSSRWDVAMEYSVPNDDDDQSDTAS